MSFEELKTTVCEAVKALEEFEKTETDQVKIAQARVSCRRAINQARDAYYKANDPTVGVH